MLVVNRAIINSFNKKNYINLRIIISEKKYEVVGIGNAVSDVIAITTDEFLIENQVEKGKIKMNIGIPAADVGRFNAVNENCWNKFILCIGLSFEYVSH